MHRKMFWGEKGVWRTGQTEESGSMIGGTSFHWKLLVAASRVGIPSHLHMAGHR